MYYFASHELRLTGEKITLTEREAREQNTNFSHKKPQFLAMKK